MRPSRLELLSWMIARGHLLAALSVPGAFAGVGRSAKAPYELAFFSFVTLTTLGYGDITPVAPVARLLAVVEALFGQLYPAILLARLVSLEVT